MWTKIHRLAAAFAVGAASLTVFTGVAAGDERGELVELYKVSISADVCGFAMSDTQAEAIGTAMDQLTAELDLSDEGADELYAETERKLEAADWEKACDPNGEWAQKYAAIVARYGD